VNKPVGLLVHGAGNEQKDTLVNRVLAYLYDRDPTAYQVFAPAPVNRLDRNTSGLVIFGKTNAVTAELAQQIAAHQVSKWYLAIVRGVLPERGEINVPLSRTDRGNRTLAVDPDASRRAAASVGKASLTRYERKATTGRTSVAKVDLVSGRTHQIRAHFERIGHPLWGDVKYGGRVSDRDGTDQHQWLHAAWMELPDGRRFHAPLPADFTAVLRRLGYTAKDLQQIETF
jgi:23S rRNA pseudouridine955/2504/2580 synthase